MAAASPIPIQATIQSFPGWVSTHRISLTARQAPELLGFPVMLCGSRVRIPREGFVRFCRAMDLEDRE